MGFNQAAADVAHRAVQADSAGDLPSAILLYREAVQLLASGPQDADTERTILHYVERASFLENGLAQGSAQAPAAAGATSGSTAGGGGGFMRSLSQAASEAERNLRLAGTAAYGAMQTEAAAPVHVVGHPAAAQPRQAQPSAPAAVEVGAAMGAAAAAIGAASVAAAKSVRGERLPVPVSSLANRALVSTGEALATSANVAHRKLFGGPNREAAGAGGAGSQGASPAVAAAQ